MDYKDLSPELKEKVAACQSMDELKALAEEEGLSLGDEELEAIAGGGCHHRPIECNSL